MIRQMHPPNAAVSVAFAFVPTISEVTNPGHFKFDERSEKLIGVE
jgi:hypothetical protein